MTMRPIYMGSVFFAMRKKESNSMAKTEIEEMGEDTAGMAESTSKLREQILALTNVNGKGGFDIMTADGKAFKSTYEILQGISKVWKDISDIDQAKFFIASMYRNVHKVNTSKTSKT